MESWSGFSSSSFRAITRTFFLVTWFVFPATRLVNASGLSEVYDSSSWRQTETTLDETVIQFSNNNTNILQRAVMLYFRSTQDITQLYFLQVTGCVSISVCSFFFFMKLIFFKNIGSPHWHWHFHSCHNHLDILTAVKLCSMKLAIFSSTQRDNYVF